MHSSPGDGTSPNSVRNCSFLPPELAVSLPRAMWCLIPRCIGAATNREERSRRDTVLLSELRNDAHPAEAMGMPAASAVRLECRQKYAFVCDDLVMHLYEREGNVCLFVVLLLLSTLYREPERASVRVGTTSA